jgi:hypothetical protein
VRKQQGRLEAAAESFERVLAADAGHAQAKRQLAEVRRRLQERARKKTPGETRVKNPPISRGVS